ncbi:MAG: DegT/DnrJ/EryC1/StrS family aminotransferase [Candidatus Latescibacterota bacterium]|nr:MAG: DegT/DnrJ/EryC1/StrS family aminotransferase [Candidatus Latescibacterota bacterium]
MGVPLLDLKAQYATIKPQILAAIEEVMESQYFILGPKVKELEDAVAAYSACGHAVGVSSGTDALLISMMTEGIGPGDEVITTPYSFFATAGCISRTGARPVFVDIDPISFNIEPTQIEAAVTDRTRAVIPVHLYGQMADMDPIMDIAGKHGLAVIEDGAQAIGAEYKGRRAGSVGDYGCFSFFPSKNLGAGGDGGMVVMNDDGRAERLRVMRGHGGKPKYYHSMIGGNFRLDALQAAVLLVKLDHLDAWTQGRQDNANAYRRLFNEAGVVVERQDMTGVKGVVLPEESPARRHIYNQFVIRVDRRDELRQWLDERSIGNEVYYPVPFHMQECFADLGYKEGDFPVSEAAARETLAVPIYPELTDDMIAEVVGAIVDFVK